MARSLTNWSVPSLRQSSPLKPNFFLRDTITVAKDLLGKGLFVQTKQGAMLAEIVETEAYLGEDDPASHAFPGMTKRNWPMFETGGMCYVYFTYGMHYCVNVVTQKKGEGHAVLFRAAIPLLGIELMQKNRGIEEIKTEKQKWNLLSGPAKLTQALGIDLRYNGRQFDEEGFKLIDLGRQFSKSRISSSPRIGISKAKETPLRFCVTESPWLSRVQRKGL